VALINLGKNPFTIHRGDRIAQLIINRVYRVQWELKESLETTERNEGGFGHTGR
jgi:dUTP pyrophosphatase